MRKNREVLRRLIDTTTLLGRPELAFRGHDESADSANKGNYGEPADVFARYDEVLSSHLSHLLFFLIESVSAVIQEEIKREIVKAPFFSRQVDETTVISCCAQLSIIVRYDDVAGVIQKHQYIYGAAFCSRAVGVVENNQFYHSN